MSSKFVRLAAGGNRIRTIGPAEKETAVERGPAADHRSLARRPVLNDPQSAYRSGISRRQQPRDLSQERDRWFESGSLQRRVRKPSVPQRRSEISALPVIERAAAGPKHANAAEADRACRIGDASADFAGIGILDNLPPRLTGHTTGHADYPASGSRIRPHAFAHGTSRPSRVRRTSPKDRDRGRKLARLRRGFCSALRAPVDGLVKPSCLGYD